MLPIPTKLSNSENVKEKPKNQKHYMTKEKFPTQLKTKQCSHCPNASYTTVKIGNEIRRLCRFCYVKFKKGGVGPPKVTFQKASTLDSFVNE